MLWDEFGRRADELPLAELQAGEFSEVIAAVRERIKTHFKAREQERRAEQVQKWKTQGDYPYEGDPQTEAERAERETFDYVATTVARKFPKTQIGRRTTLGLLKVAVANEPSSVPEILDQLMPLPKREQDDLARLLVRTSMSKLIAANTTLTNRLDFLAVLREMVFDTSTSKRVKERKELHRILEKELWVFGDEYALLASDKGLDEVLARHLEVLRPPGSKRKRAKSTAVRRADGTRGIVDLMLSQQRRGVDQREHLVVELKRPSVTITQVEAAQIKSYADAVATDPQFTAINVHWDFWIISSDLDSTVSRDATQLNLPNGQIAAWGNIRIWAKTWSQVIDECETRLRHFRDALEYDASREHAADYINRAHDAKIIPAPLRSVGGKPAGDAA